MGSFPRLEPVDALALGWKVKAVDKTKLVVYGHKDDPIKKVEFKVDTFDVKVKGNVTPPCAESRKGEASSAPDAGP